MLNLIIKGNPQDDQEICQETGGLKLWEEPIERVTTVTNTAWIRIKKREVQKNGNNWYKKTNGPIKITKYLISFCIFRLSFLVETSDLSLKNSTFTSP